MNPTNPPLYSLTWPAAQHGVCVVAGQWQRNGAGEIEATYTPEQLALCNAAMLAARDDPASAGVEE